MRTLFVPNIEAAEAAHAANLHQQYDEWVSFRLSVMAYCEQHHIHCADLNTFVTATELKDIFYALLPSFSDLLIYLDKFNSPTLNCFSDLPALNWYFSVFRLAGLCEYTGMVLFDKSFTRYLEARRVEQLHLYGNFDLGPCLLLGKHYLELTQEIAAAANVPFTQCVLARAHLGTTTTLVVTNIRRSLLSWWRKARLARYLAANYARNRKRKKGSGTLIFEPLYEAHFLPLALQKVYYWPHHPTGLPWGLPAQGPGRLRSTTNLPVTPTLPLRFLNMKHAQLYATLLTDFLRSNIRKFDAALYGALWLIKEHCIDEAILPMPATAAEPKALVVELLRKSGVQVFGLQHGGNYGDQDCDQFWLLSDYLYYDTFLAYKENSSNWIYMPEITLSPCKIVAVGSLKGYAQHSQPTKQNFTQRTQILFPITIVPDLSDGVPFEKGDSFFRSQEAILACLEAQSCSVIIKPIKNYSLRADLRHRYPTHSTLRKLRHCKIDATISYEEALKWYRPRLVILDSLSTPLYETLAFDCDIIQLIDPLCPPKVAVRTMLQARVHFADTAEQLLGFIEAFVSGNLLMLRNNEYYNQCVCPPGDAIQRVCGHLRWFQWAA